MFGKDRILTGLWKPFFQSRWNWKTLINIEMGSLSWSKTRYLYNFHPVIVKSSLNISKRFCWTWRKSIDVCIVTNSKISSYPNLWTQQCRCLSVSATVYKRAEVKRELADKKAKLPKVYDVWRNITVQELSKVLNRSEGKMKI